MLWLFSRFILRQLARHPAMAVLNILGVALGVAIFTGMQIANESSLRAFRQTIDVVAGRSQLEITADFGRFDERLFQTVTAGDGVGAATPTVEAICAVMTPASDGDAPESFTARAPIRILGLDIFSNRAFRPLDFGGADASAGSRALPEARWRNSSRSRAPSPCQKKPPTLWGWALATPCMFWSDRKSCPWSL
ncbi:hypothetical protein QQ056_10380 [Oscillatoria laete-virens NRMC-F 0139]|nr:hypothetical protein [Oscillatoria laete-virens]MDL5053951.1 hypothetical protein [Oscillatoria laete-virens NRMC-F 0139]